MVAIGALLAFIGAVILLIGGSNPGSQSARVVRFNNMSGPFVTPGHRNRPPSTWRGALKRIALGVGLIALGVVLIGLKIGF